MDDHRMRQLARLLRRAGSARLAERARGGAQLRITVSHFLDAGLTENFRSVVAALAERHQIVGPREVVEAFARRPAALPARRGLALSFDDGLLSSYQAAQEVLNPLGIKAMFFVPTKIMDLRTHDQMREFFESRVYRRVTPGLPPERFVTMTAGHLRELHEQGHAVFAHTHTHAALSEIRTAQDADAELRRPRALLEDLLGAPAPLFAFPFGHERVVTAYAYRQVVDAFDACVTGLMGANTPRTPPHALYRDCVHTSDAPDYAVDITAGALDPIYALKMRRLRRRAAVFA